FVEADGVHHQRVAFPMSHRMTEVSGVRVFRMRASIHVDFTPDVTTAFEDDDDAIILLDELGRIGRAHGARTAGWQTESLRIVRYPGGLVVFPHRVSPRQHG